MGDIYMSPLLTPPLASQLCASKFDFCGTFLPVQLSVRDLIALWYIIVRVRTFLKIGDLATTYVFPRPTCTYTAYAERSGVLNTLWREQDLNL